MMAVLISRWMIVIITVNAILLLLYLGGQKSVQAELIIEANPQKIWDILMDEESYQKWNQVLIPIKGKIEQGNMLTYKLVLPEGHPIEIGMKVAKLVPPKLLNQNGGFPGIFTYNHRYILEPVGNSTKVTIHEYFRGIAVPFWDTGWLEQAYIDLNKSLREYILD